MARVTIRNAGAGKPAAGIEGDVLAPSAQIVNEANRTVTVTDAQGRVLTLKRVNRLDKMRLFECLGPDLVRNQLYLANAAAVAHIVAIDGEPIAKPATKRELEALIARLDDDGVDAAMNGVADHFAPPAKGADGEIDKEKLKNE